MAGDALAEAERRPGPGPSASGCEPYREITEAALPKAEVESRWQSGLPAPPSPRGALPSDRCAPRERRGAAPRATGRRTTPPAPRSRKEDRASRPRRAVLRWLESRPTRGRIPGRRPLRSSVRLRPRLAVKYRRSGSQRDPHADIARALRHQIRGDSIEPRGGEPVNPQTPPMFPIVLSRRLDGLPPHTALVLRRALFQVVPVARGPVRVAGRRLRRLRLKPANSYPEGLLGRIQPEERYLTSLVAQRVNGWRATIPLPSSMVRI